MISRHSPSTYAWCGLVILLFTVTAAGQLSINPSTVNFGSVQVGTSVSHSVVLTNAGSESLTIFQAKVFGTAFSVSGLGTPLTLAPEQTATFAATFLPQAGVSFSGSVSLEYSEPNERHRRTAALALVGTGAGPQAGDPLSTLALNPNSITFGNVTVGSSLHASGTLTNSGRLELDGLSGNAFGEQFLHKWFNSTPHSWSGTKCRFLDNVHTAIDRQHKWKRAFQFQCVRSNFEPATFGDRSIAGNADGESFEPRVRKRSGWQQRRLV